MEQTRLFQLLRTLNAYEWNRFEKFLHSPYYNEERRVGENYSRAGACVPEAGRRSLQQKQVWNAVYPSQLSVN